MRFRLALAGLISAVALEPALGAELNVASARALRDAVDRARAGDVIVLAPGSYVLDSPLWTRSGGTDAQPITLRGKSAADTRIDFTSSEGFVVNHSRWILDSIWVNAACAPFERCEIGIHVKPSARGFLLIHARVSNWYQHVKASRDSVAEVEDAAIIGTELYNDQPRHSLPIDIVGGKRWRIAGNYVHDFGGSSEGDFGIFLKGGTSDGIIEGNLVLCAQDLPPSGASVGISLGQGGTDPSYCADGACTCEDRGSVVRNNIVGFCSDAGLHARRACGGRFLNNTVYETRFGLQVQEEGPEAPIEIRNNLMTRHIVGKRSFLASDNALDVSDALFRRVYASPDSVDFSEGTNSESARDLARSMDDVSVDYCGRMRERAADLGAIEFPSTCATWPWSAAQANLGPELPSWRRNGWSFEDSSSREIHGGGCSVTRSLPVCPGDGCWLVCFIAWLCVRSWRQPPRRFRRSPPFECARTSSRES